MGHTVQAPLDVDVLNVGSLNIDHVYAVERFAAAGETLGTAGYRVFAGGKGFNQSIALARAGARVAHAGRVGGDGEWLVEKLRAEGVATATIERSSGATGHAVIQVRHDGENAIFVHGGANRELEPRRVASLLARLRPGALLLLQNEVNDLPEMLEAARHRGVEVALNPSPLDATLLAAPLSGVAVLVLNEGEARGLTGEGEPRAALDALAARLPEAEVVLTRGARGALYARGRERAASPAPRVEAVDTTGAGDTFTGYYLAARARAAPPERRLAFACSAASLAVTRPGAADAIPSREEIAD